MRSIELNRLKPYPEPCLIIANNDEELESTDTKTVNSKTRLQKENKSSPIHDPEIPGECSTDSNLKSRKNVRRNKGQPARVQEPERASQSTPLFQSNQPSSSDKDALRSFRSDIELLARTYISNFSLLPAPVKRLNLTCNISQIESSNAKRKMHQLKLNDQESGFDRRNTDKKHAFALALENRKKLVIQDLKKI